MTNTRSTSDSSDPGETCMKDASTSATRRLLAAMAPQAGVAVAFHLPTVRQVADDEQVRGMYFLDDQVDLDEIEAIAMSVGGPARLLRDGTILLPPACPRSANSGPSLLESHASELKHLEPLGQLCIGVGRLPGLPPVALALDFKDGFARGAAVLRSEPHGAGLDLLPAIGVRLLGSSTLPDGRVRLEIENRLEAHLDAARLSSFQRTNQCNRFFLSHGDAGGDIENGLLQAAQVRIAEGRRRVSAAVISLARRAIDEGLSLHMRAPGRSETTPYGDLVPLGFLGAALERIAASNEESASKAGPLLADLRAHLESHRRSWGWGYSRGCIPTSTDTALVALAGVTPNFEGMETLRGPTGGFTPQLVAEDAGPDAMQRSEATAHWEMEDVPTTALIETLRMDAGLEAGVDAAWFLKRIPKWAGLYFTPPMLGFWSIAGFLARLEQQHASSSEGDEDDTKKTSPERIDNLKGVLAHLLDSHLEPGSRHDSFNPVLDESLMVLARAELGAVDRASLIGQLRMLDAWEHPRGVETPFYSTLVNPPARSIEEIMAIQSDPHRAFVHGRVHKASTYEDPDRLVVTALACLALHVETTASLGQRRSRFINLDSGSTPLEQAFLNVQSYAVPTRSLGEDPSDPFVVPRDRIPLADAMTWTLDRLGPELVSARSRSRVLAAVEKTNPEHVKGATFGLELRLHGGDDTIDFLWCLSRASRNLTALLSEPDRHSRFRQLARLWNVPQGGEPPPIAHIDSIWFEHDLDRDSTDIPPAFFFGPSFLYMKAPATSANEAQMAYGVQEVANNVRRVVNMLDLNEEVSRSLLDSADRVASIETDIPVFQTGLMFSRSAQPIRLCFSPRLGTEVVTELMNQLGLGERIPDVASILPLLEGGRTAVCVDITPDGTDPRIGLECYSDKNTDRNLHAPRLLGQLADRGHVSRTRTSPFSAIEGWTQLGPHGGVERRINHIKLVSRPNRPLEVKGYLALTRTPSPTPAMFRDHRAR